MKKTKCIFEHGGIVTGLDYKIPIVLNSDNTTGIGETVLNKHQAAKIIKGLKSLNP